MDSLLPEKRFHMGSQTAKFELTLKSPEKNEPKKLIINQSVEPTRNVCLCNREFRDRVENFFDFLFNPIFSCLAQHFTTEKKKKYELIFFNREDFDFLCTYFCRGKYVETKLLI